MHTVTFGIDAGDHLSVSVNRRTSPGDDWLQATIKISAGPFSGVVSAYLMTADFPRFRRELEELHRTLDGVATFSTIETQLGIECTGNGLGGIRVSGFVWDKPNDGNELKFEFETDQTFLPQIISQIAEIERSFPNRTSPDFPL